MAHIRGTCPVCISRSPGRVLTADSAVKARLHSRRAPCKRRHVSNMQQRSSVANESVPPKTMINNTGKYFLNCNQHFGNFKL